MLGRNPKCWPPLASRIWPGIITQASNDRRRFTPQPNRLCRHKAPFSVCSTQFFRCSTAIMQSRASGGGVCRWACETRSHPLPFSGSSPVAPDIQISLKGPHDADSQLTTLLSHEQDAVVLVPHRSNPPAAHAAVRDHLCELHLPDLFHTGHPRSQVALRISRRVNYPRELDQPPQTPRKEHV
jgi:hypothetical protein